jgi:hypothetical protein
MLTLAQAGASLGVAPATLRNQLRLGRLHGRKVGTVWTISEREVERYRAESLGRPGRHAPSPKTSGG